MNKLSLSALFSGLVFLIVVYIGLPKVFVFSDLMVNLDSFATPEQKQVIERGKASAQVFSQMKNGKILSQQDVQEIVGVRFSTAIFPPDLTFPIQPSEPPEKEKATAQDQRIILLENQLHALQTQINLLKDTKQGWNWGDQIWAVIIWIVGVVFSTILKRATENFLNGSKSPKKPPRPVRPRKLK